MASIQNKSDQLRFKGKGPLDAKSLVKTYAELLDVDTWTVDGTFVAYNGMIVAVWLDKTDASNNGVYYLFDPDVTSAIGKPKVAIEDNWHKISDKIDTSVIESTLEEHEARIKSIEEKTPVETYGYRSGFPTIGETNKMYVAVDEAKTYIWYNNEYLPVGGDSAEPEVIYGGTAD